VESKISTLYSTRGRIIAWIGLKLVLCYVLIGYTGDLQSSYWLLLALPVLSAATALGAVGTLVVALAAAGSYLSYYFFYDWSRLFLDPYDVSELVLRVVFLAMVGTLVNLLAEDLRIETQRSREAADQLSQANQQ